MHYSKDFKHVWIDLWINRAAIGLGFIYDNKHLTTYFGPFILDVQVI